MHRIFRVCTAIALAVASFACCPRQASAATPEQIDQAIDKAQKYLFSQQKDSGRWETDAHRLGDLHSDWQAMQGSSWGGYTAIATYALLASGAKPDDPRIVKAVNFLKTADIIGNYALGLRLQVWLLMWQNSSAKDRGQYVQLAQADVNKLIKGVHTDGPLKGLWTYLPVNALPAEAGSRIDHSVSQYGILGLWAGAQMGCEFDSRYWAMFDQRWRDDQFPDGAWSYSETGANPRPLEIEPSMTAAGIASLFIIQQYTAEAKKGISCTGNIANDNIDTGLIWMTKHFSEARNLYTFYGIERIGVASGYKYFGTIDWYASIADLLVKAQNANGCWHGNGVAAFPGESPIPAASYGLLFLARGGAPVMMNKLDYSILAKGNKKQRQGNWNERPRDAFNLAQWSGDQAEADLNWQVVNLDVSVKDLHDAPILYLAGNQDLNLAVANIDKLREFANEGGLILGNADCGSLIFKKSFIDLGHKLFPKYEFADVGKDSIIYTEAQHAKIRGRIPLMGLSNGVRFLMLLMPNDSARAWQNKVTFGEFHDDFQLGFDIFLYSIDTKGLRKKGVYYLVDAKPAVHPNKTIKVARLMVGENPDPEPGGWPRLCAILHNDYDLDVEVTAVKPGDDLKGFKIVDITGTTAFKLTDAQRANLLKFTQAGGTLIIDAAGGNGVFAESAETELANIFGKDAAALGLARPLPPESGVYHLPHAEIKQVAYRQFAKLRLTGRPNAPHIRGIEVNKRIVAFYSREDLSAGLVGEEVDGILGYTPNDATDLMRNLVLFAAK